MGNRGFCKINKMVENRRRRLYWSVGGTRGRRWNTGGRGRGFVHSDGSLFRQLRLPTVNDLRCADEVQSHPSWINGHAGAVDVVARRGLGLAKVLIACQRRACDVVLCLGQAWDNTDDGGMDCWAGKGSGWVDDKEVDDGGIRGGGCCSCKGRGDSAEDGQNKFGMVHFGVGVWCVSMLDYDCQEQWKVRMGKSSLGLEQLISETLTSETGSVRGCTLVNTHILDQELSTSLLP